jgi:O-succinylbenzoate synthase
LPIDGVEEPLRDPDLAFLAGLQASVPFPLAIDESTHLIACDFWRAPPVRRLVIKPARHGGLAASADLALRARANGVEVIVTSALESACGILALAHLAAAVSPDAVHGLATGEWLASDTGLPPRIIDGRMQLPKGNGIGFAVAGELCGRVAT